MVSEINHELDFDLRESVVDFPSKEYFLTSPVSIKDQSWSEATVPFVSVVCKTFMHEKYIRECLDGFLMQKTTFPVEIVINDDASTDRTTEIILEYQTKYPRLFKTTFQTENQYKKKPKTPNYIKPFEKRGKYIAKCEGDDYWTDPMKLQKQVEILEANPAFSACFTNAEVLNEFGNNSTSDYVTLFKEGVIELKDIVLMGGYIYPTASIVYWKDKVNRTVYNQNINLAGDSLLILSLALNGNVFFMNQKTCVYRRWSGGFFSGMEKNHEMLVKYKTKEIEAYRKLDQILDYKLSNFIQKKISLISLEILYQGKSLRHFWLFFSINRYRSFNILFGVFLKKLKRLF